MHNASASMEQKYRVSYVNVLAFNLRESLVVQSSVVTDETCIHYFITFIFSCTESSSVQSGKK